MPGPKYVNDFEFPSNFGFTGSATDRSTIAVRGHDRNKPRFARGGRVRTAEEAGAGKARPLTPDEKEQIDAENQGRRPRTARQRLRETLGGQATEREMKRLGLKKGGRTKKAMGGPVKAKSGGMHRMPGGKMMSDSEMEKMHRRRKIK